MSMNLLDQVKDLFTSEVVQQAAGQFGESESAVTKAISGIVPGLLGGLIGKSETPGGANAVFSLIQQAAGDGPVSNIAGLLGNQQMLSGGWELVKGLFGTQSDNLLGKLASFSGTKVSSTTGLLGMAAPMVMGWLGKFVKDQSLNASGLASLFSSQKSAVMSAIPSGLGLGDIFSNAFSAGEPKAAPAAYAPQESSSGGGNKWLWPLLLLLGLGALIWWLLSNRKTEEKAETVQETVADATQTAAAVVKGTVDSLGNFIYDVGSLKEIILPGDVKLNVGENSSEAKLFNFLNDNAVTVNETDKTQGWISLDRLYFETGKNMLTATSMDQLKNIAAILKAFPNATLKMGGYTDNTGDSAANVALSDARAKVAMEALKGLGIAGNRLEAEGYGPMHPIAGNDTDAGRAQNRRVDVRVTKK